MIPWNLIVADTRRMWLGVLMTILLIALATALSIAISLQERAFRLGSARAAEQFDLVIGAPGSEAQLVLSSVFLQPSALSLIPAKTVDELNADPRVRWASPIAFGDFYKEAPIVGVIPEILGANGIFKIKEGHLFKETFDAIAGPLTDLKIGDEFSPVHAGLDGAPGHTHDEIHYKIVGRFAPTGTAWDRSVLVPVEAVWQIHEHPHDHHHDEHGNHDHHAHEHSHDDQKAHEHHHDEHGAHDHHHAHEHSHDDQKAHDDHHHDEHGAHDHHHAHEHPHDDQKAHDHHHDEHGAHDHHHAHEHSHDDQKAHEHHHDEHGAHDHHHAHEHSHDDQKVHEHHHDEHGAHDHHHAHEHSHGKQSLSEIHAKRGVPAIVVKPISIADAYQLRAQYRSASTMAVFPGEVLVKMYGALGDLRSLLHYLSVGTQALVAVALTMLAILHLRQRRRQIGALRAFGASRLGIVGMLWTALMLLVAIGIAVGLLLGHLSANIISTLMQHKTGFGLPVEFALEDLWFVIALFAIVAIVMTGAAFIGYNKSPAEAMRS